jgi:hypothetical protein
LQRRCRFRGDTTLSEISRNTPITESKAHDA